MISLEETTFINNYRYTYENLCRATRPGRFENAFVIPFLDDSEFSLGHIGIAFDTALPASAGTANILSLSTFHSRIVQLKAKICLLFSSISRATAAEQARRPAEDLQRDVRVVTCIRGTGGCILQDQR